MTTERPDIAIVGGGICGLTTALALEQRGWAPTVYETASEFRPIGAGILLQTNALLILDRLGIADRVRESGVPLEDSSIRSANGQVLTRFDLDRVERADFGYGFVAIHRAELQRILLEELDAEVRTGMACKAVTDTDTPAVRFTDGTHIEPDILIGTDGIDSVIRDAVAPNVEPRVLDSIAYRAIATVDLPEQHRTRGIEVWGEGTYTGGAPIDEDRFYWFATASESAVEWQTDSQPTKAMLRELFSAFPAPIPAVVESIDTDTVFSTDLADVPSLERWHHGSVIVAGDAAHGMLPFAGQGAAQAIEDALTLAHEITTRGTSAAAFETFETKRKPRADRIRVESHHLGALSTIQSRVGTRIRNLSVRVLPDATFRRARRRRALHTSLPETTDSDQHFDIR
ncbi:FAD-dependent oxidoreductase [Natrialba aegyptia]|uniref:Zeaxanthin epoxidase n=1 Tax=Natrialba aegyptia DSM 13077 TaxID=1227491 RepID=M0B1X2_9EURY|nr:FAD-dependent monooxygenase [Natrialba aegyptia]ELZ04238.1 Zeaxanthin epoxidase [Natrialba aegyptia DSM 13077]